MEKQSLVSVIALNYNNFNYVISALESISDQDYDNIELVIVDDCSTDGSVLLVEEWVEKCKIPVFLIKHDINLGVCAACNSGLRAANGKYICIIATDDLMVSDRITYQVSLLDKTGDNVCGTYSDMVLINEYDEIIEDSYYQVIGVNDTILNSIYNMNMLDRLCFLIEKNVFPAPSMLYKKDAINNIGGWDEKLYFEDWDMNLRLIRSGYDFIWSNNKLIRYRFMQSSMARKPNPVYLDTCLRVISKYIGMSDRIDEIVNSRIEEYSKLIYLLDGGSSYYWLKKRFAIKKNFKNFSLMLLSFFGLKYGFIKNNFTYMYKLVINLFKRILSRIKEEEDILAKVKRDFSFVDQSFNMLEPYGLYVSDNCYLRINKNVFFRKFCNIHVHESARLIINDNVFFNNSCSVNCLGNISIGENTLFGEGVKIYDHNHLYAFKNNDLEVDRNSFKVSSVSIGKNCWIGSNVVILPNVIIGDNVIIGAGNLIYSSVPSNVIVKSNTGVTIQELKNSINHLK